MTAEKVFRSICEPLNNESDIEEFLRRSAAYLRYVYFGSYLIALIGLRLSNLVIHESLVKSLQDTFYNYFRERINEYVENGSGFNFKSMSTAYLHVAKFNPLRR